MASNVYSAVVKFISQKTTTKPRPGVEVYEYTGGPVYETNRTALNEYLQQPVTYCKHARKHGCGLRAVDSARGLCRPCSLLCSVEENEDKETLSYPPGDYNRGRKLSQAVEKGVMFGDMADHWTK